VTARRLRSDAARLRREADALEARARQMREVAAELDAAASKIDELRGGNRSGTVTSDMQADHRLAIARGRTHRHDAFAEALERSGYSVRSLAAAVGVSHAMLSMARAGKRRLSDDVAARIEKLTGFRF
jgi:ribosome-binding protein aMBF1 (putative translation factor)